ncbi:DUF4389 domain-containing protein [Streptomyces tateyamensis]|uniref:DUF4389 domain-containing protein n=1 Tax=Streptomyces tateyamensis TaxID=565073 RepID=A0A2V4NX21_9ACTN|nr:DUF4389 domain-containing protein [Streptomyces tateyamensis]PYC75800.1 DUF4389 domain-containing protein [Streptomyces tateyamensis]
MAQSAGTGSWTVPEPVGPPEFLPVLDVPAHGRQRRWTVLLRWLILIPHYIVLWVLGIGAFFAVVVGWFAALFLGRLPAPIARYLIGFVGYDTRLMVSQALLVDQYPPFSLRQPRDYPVRIELRPGRLNRLAVFFRLLLMIPAAIISGLAAAGWAVLAVFLWLWTLVTARLPRPAFEATAAMVRYRMRFTAYALMLTSAYPKGLFGEERGNEPRESATRPLVLSGAGKGLLVAYLVLGLAVDAGGSVGGSYHNTTDDGTVSTAPAVHARA